MYSQPWSPTPFDNRGGAGVANSEPLARHAVEESLAGSRAVKHDVADQDVLFRHEVGPLRRDRRSDSSAGESLADVIVGVAFERQRHALRQKRAEALAGRAVEVELDRVFRQTRRSVLLRDLTRTASRPRCDARS